MWPILIQISIYFRYSKWGMRRTGNFLLVDYLRRLRKMICRLNFISCMDYRLTSLSFQEYFGKFGELDSVKLKMDPMTGNLPVTYKNWFLIRSIPGICLHFIQDWGGTWQVNRSKFLFSYLSLQWLVRKYVLWYNVLLIDYYI